VAVEGAFGWEAAGDKTESVVRPAWNAVRVEALSVEAAVDDDRSLTESASCENGEPAKR
jgi:hypothetical protein